MDSLKGVVPHLSFLEKILVKLFSFPFEVSFPYRVIFVDSKKSSH